MTTKQALATHLGRVVANRALSKEGFFMKLGFTGSRKGMTERQSGHLIRVLGSFNVVEFHHGDCVGADAEAHDIVVDMGIRVIVHPPIDPKYRAWCEGNEMRDELPYIERNHNIVDETLHLFAAPSTNHEVRRSGTWATIRYHRDKAAGSLWLPLPD